MDIEKIIVGSSYSKIINVNYKKLIKNGVTSSLPHYLIKESGKIISLIPEDKHTNFSNTIHDKNSISILLENSGYFSYNYLDDKYYDVFGTIYNNKIEEKIWRSKKYWAPYPNKQILALKELCLDICKRYDLQPKVVSDNTINRANLKKTIISRSNIDPIYMDLNPTFDFNVLKEIENEYESK